MDIFKMRTTLGRIGLAGGILTVVAGITYVNHYLKNRDTIQKRRNRFKRYLALAPPPSLDRDADK